MRHLFRAVTHYIHECYNKFKMNNNQKLPGYEYEKVPIKENIPGK